MQANREEKQKKVKSRNLKVYMYHDSKLNTKVRLLKHEGLINTYMKNKNEPLDHNIKRLNVLVTMNNVCFIMEI